MIDAEAPALKAITVKNPWAWSILHAGKDVENRSQSINHRGTLYIHVAKRDDEAGYENETFRQGTRQGATGSQEQPPLAGPRPRHGGSRGLPLLHRMPNRRGLLL